MNNKLQILNKIFSYHLWRHRVDLGDGLRTMGYNTLNHDWEFYGMPENLKWKTVLDIGANDGYYSFGAEQRGASAVTAIDIYGGDGDTMVGGWPDAGIKMLKEYLNSQVEIKACSIYNLPELNKKWDVVFCNDVLSWLDDIDGALNIISDAAIETLVIRDTFSTEPSAQINPIKKPHSKGYFNRMGVHYLKRKLKEKGFRKIQVKRIFSFKHYEWQFENFPSAESSGIVNIYISPLDANSSNTAVVNGQWVLMKYNQFAFVRTIGWVRIEDIRIKSIPKKNRLVAAVKKLIPKKLMELYYNSAAIEKKVHEYRIIASR